MRYDIAIAGSGPAGMAAALNAKIRNKNKRWRKYLVKGAGYCEGKPYQYLNSSGKGQMAVSSAISHLGKLRINQMSLQK